MNRLKFWLMILGPIIVFLVMIMPEISRREEEEPEEPEFFDRD